MQRVYILQLAPALRPACSRMKYEADEMSEVQVTNGRIMKLRRYTGAQSPEKTFTRVMTAGLKVMRCPTERTH